MKMYVFTYLLIAFNAIAWSQPSLGSTFFKNIDDILKLKQVRVIVIDENDRLKPSERVEQQLLNRYSKNANFKLIDRLTIVIALEEIELQYHGLFNKEYQLQLGNFFSATHLCIVDNHVVRLIELETMEVVSVWEGKPSYEKNGILDELNFNIDFSIRGGQRRDKSNSDLVNYFSIVTAGFGVRTFNLFDSFGFSGILYEQTQWHGTTATNIPDKYSIIIGARVIATLKYFGIIGEMTIFSGEYIDGLAPSFGIEFLDLYGIITFIAEDSILFGAGYIIRL